jgi:8-oxo-dGTP pyrophosphatase MutT (NUDIX family)
MTEQKTTVTPRPAATLLMIRDGDDGLEVFMVKRHHMIDFTPGALVFPGGRVSDGDSHAALENLTDGGNEWDAEMRAFAAAAIRETFEESGILLAREADSGNFVSAERLLALEPYRGALDRHEIDLADLLKKENLRLACEGMERFAHWITPETLPKRFDTQFFLAATPYGHAGSHDGRESVDSVWITPNAALADRTKWNIIFPTKLNLMMLAESKTVADALAAARATTPVPVTPWLEQSPEGPLLKIREDAGYAQTWTYARDGM